MNAATGFDPVVGVLSAVLLAALLALTTRRLTRSLRVFLPRTRPPAGTDYGLLVPVATVPTREDAEMLREVLAGHGIRATAAPAHPGGGRSPVHLLVFPGDAARARDVVATR